MRPGLVIVGGGAVGASAALHAARRGADVVVLEKEDGVARHQSGRNSGVIHAGYNLAPGSAKARYCVGGNRAMHAFCEAHGVPLRRGGILVVARTPEEEATLATLRERARGNGTRAQMLAGDEIPSVEPHARGTMAMHAPEGSSVDGRAYVEALRREAGAAGAAFRFGIRVRGWEEHADGVTVRTDQGPLAADALLNAAGLHADRVAQALCPDMRVVPFRGFYARLAPGARHMVRSHVYAAPDLDFPFLGVHLSRRTDGEVAVGPGAMLAFGREAYHPWQVSPRDLTATLAWPGTRRLLGDPRIRRLTWSETRKSLRLRAIWEEAVRLVPGLRPRDLRRGIPAGNRAQMVDRAGRLVGDVVVRDTARTVHVLNAVSPGLTCSLPFGEHLATQAVAKLSGAGLS